MWLPWAASLHKSKGIGEQGGCWGCECARRVCKISVQGERARGEVPHMGMGGCCAAASLHKFKGEWWVGAGVLGM